VPTPDAARPPPDHTLLRPALRLRILDEALFGLLLVISLNPRTQYSASEGVQRSTMSLCIKSTTFPSQPLGGRNHNPAPSRVVSYRCAVCCPHPKSDEEGKYSKGRFPNATGIEKKCNPSGTRVRPARISISEVRSPPLGGKTSETAKCQNPNPLLTRSTVGRLATGSPRHEIAPCVGASAWDQPGCRRSRTSGPARICNQAAPAMVSAFACRHCRSLMPRLLPFCALPVTRPFRPVPAFTRIEKCFRNSTYYQSHGCASFRDAAENECWAPTKGDDRTRGR